MVPTAQFHFAIQPHPHPRHFAGKMVVRQQLQQHLRNQVHQLRGYGDYLRRNLKLVLELAQDPTAPSADPQAGSRITAREVDRIRFLMLPPRPRQGEQGRMADAHAQNWDVSHPHQLVAFFFPARIERTLV
jgi:hypothetical protein